MRRAAPEGPRGQCGKDHTCIPRHRGFSLSRWHPSRGSHIVRKLKQLCGGLHEGRNQGLLPTASQWAHHLGSQYCSPSQMRAAPADVWTETSVETTNWDQPVTLFSCWVMSDSSQPHGLQHRRLPLPFTISQSLLKLMSIELAMPSNHLILCCPLLLLRSIFPGIRVFSRGSALCFFVFGREETLRLSEVILPCFMVELKSFGKWWWLTSSYPPIFLILRLVLNNKGNASWCKEKKNRKWSNWRE